MRFAKIHISIFLLFVVLVFTRFVGLDWGLPYPMHPDERNMVVALLQIDCHQGPIIKCMNPHFFAYGQLPLYLGLIVFQFLHAIFPNLTTFDLATIALRIISASFSIFTVIVLMKMIRLFQINDKLSLFVFYLMATFTPAFIQFAHFGTTESALMFFYAFLMYLSLKYILRQSTERSFAIGSGIVLGLALGTKVSSIIFAAIPILAMVFGLSFVGKSTLVQRLLTFLKAVLIFFLTSVLLFLISSPFNFIAWNEFVGSMRYEADVGFGIYRAFYTRQFEYAVPVLFQSVKIFPYVLGMPIYLLFSLGFLFLPWKKEYVFLRLQFLLFFIPTAFLYAKWTRFLVPVFPLMVLFAGLMLIQIFKKITTYKYFYQVTLLAIVTVSIIPGIAFLAIYTSPDVRFTASEWIHSNISKNYYILSETANVVDIPLMGNGYRVVSFNFYDLENDFQLKDFLKMHISLADYVFVPSRRIFANHTCYEFDESLLNVSLTGYKKERCVELNKRYPKINEYYNDLFNSSEYKLVQEVKSYPRIEMFGKILITLPDENAEETWTVFDHPVIRIYKKI